MARASDAQKTERLNLARRLLREHPHLPDAADRLARACAEEARGIGLGVCLEAHIVYQYLYEDAACNWRFLPVLLSGGRVDDIHTALR